MSYARRSESREVRELRAAAHEALQLFRDIEARYHCGGAMLKQISLDALAASVRYNHAKARLAQLDPHASRSFRRL